MSTKVNECRICGTHRLYCPYVDAFFCPTCNVWLEEPCGDANCEFCSVRPDRPSVCSHPASEHEVMTVAD